MTSQRVVRRAPRHKARKRLFCFPYAGGSASLFRGWETAFGPDVDVCAVELSGRGGRIDEAPARSWDELMSDVETSLRPWLDVPYVLFGHSLGARIAFETARRAVSTLTPSRVVVSACPSPDRERHENISALSDEAFVARILRLGGTAAEVLEHPELRALFLPILRADYALVDTVPPVDGPIRCPITALAGTEDVDVPQSEVESWERYGSGFRFVAVPGGHLFLVSHRARVVSELGRDLAAD